eukprot:gene6288-10295_t
MNFFQKKKKSTKVFGETLEEAANKTDPYKLIPFIVKSSVAFLNKYGLNEEGLYRIPGSKKRVREYIERTNKGELLDFIKMHKKTPISCQNIASLLMDYFKALPEPLLTFELESKFIEVAKDTNLDDSKKIKEIQNLIQQLPLVNRQTAKLYFDHLKRVTEHSEENHMTETNIVICVVGGRPVTPIYVLFLKYFEEIFLGVSGKDKEENFKKENLTYTISTLEGFDTQTNEEQVHQISELQQKIQNEQRNESFGSNTFSDDEEGIQFQPELLLESEQQIIEEEQNKKINHDDDSGLVREIKETETTTEESERNLENIKLMLSQNNLFQDLSNKPQKKPVQTSFVKPREVISNMDESEINRWNSKDSNDFNQNFHIIQPDGIMLHEAFERSPIPVGSKKHSKRSRKSSGHSRTTSTDIPTDVDCYVDSPCDSETTISPRNGLNHSQKLGHHLIIKNKILEKHETQLDQVEKIQDNDDDYEDLPIKNLELL